MPLVHSKSPGAFKTNVRTLMHDVGKSPHVQSRKQALAIAYSTARRAGAKMASGGLTPPMGERMAARQAFHEGFLHSSVPGRTDKLPISVSGGSYVLPADHVAALGQGNSLAGANIVNKMFKMGPAGSAPSPQKAAHASQPKLNLTPRVGKMSMKGGGTEGHGEPTPIVAAGGEIVIPAHKIKEKFGDIDHGHKVLDHWVNETRKRHIKTLKGLKPPRKN
jgi:hypothetical protein